MVMSGMSNEPDTPPLPPVFFDEWLEAKNLSRTIAADAMGTTTSKLSKLVNGHQQWTTEWLARAADVIGIQPADLFRPPSDPDAPTAPKPTSDAPTGPNQDLPRAERIAWYWMQLSTEDQETRRVLLALLDALEKQDATPSQGSPGRRG